MNKSLPNIGRKIKGFLKLDLQHNRVYGLDILRAIAILFVLVQHSKYILPIKITHFINLIYFDGVGIFFVLSGFLIGGILIKIIHNKGFNHKLLFGFWKRRWFRTLPAYYLVLFLNLILALFSNPNFKILVFPKYLIFSQNILTNPPDFFSESWSITIEEWFYAFVPILLFIFVQLFKFKTKNSILAIAVLIMFLGTIIRYYRFVHFGLNLELSIISRFDNIMYGVLGAFFYFYYQKNWFKYRIQFFILGIILHLLNKILIDFATIPIYENVFSYSVFATATLFLIPYLSSVKKGSGVVFKAITYTSLISYSMYLLNFSLIYYWIVKKIDLTTALHHNYNLILPIKFILFWFLTFLFSLLLYKYFELPMTNLRDRKKVL